MTTIKNMARRTDAPGNGRNKKIEKRKLQGEGNPICFLQMTFSPPSKLGDDKTMYFPSSTPSGVPVFLLLLIHCFVNLCPHESPFSFDSDELSPHRAKC
jgi:hypothetical protein